MRPRRGLRAASWRRRVVAQAIDLLALLAAIASGGGGLVVWVDRRRRAGGGLEDPLALEPSRRWRITLKLLATIASVQARNVPSPGARMMGLRRVDARTGGPISPRSALIRLATAEALRLLLGRPSPRWREHHQALDAQAARLTERYPTDPHARQRALLDLYTNNANNASCLPQLLGALAVILIPALRPPHQTLPDRLAGILTIDDHPTTARPRPRARQR